MGVWVSGWEEAVSRRGFKGCASAGLTGGAERCLWGARGDRWESTAPPRLWRRFSLKFADTYFSSTLLISPACIIAMTKRTCQLASSHFKAKPLFLSLSPLSLSLYLAPKQLCYLFLSHICKNMQLITIILRSSNNSQIVAFENFRFDQTNRNYINVDFVATCYRWLRYKMVMRAFILKSIWVPPPLEILLRRRAENSIALRGNFNYAAIMSNFHICKQL